MRSEANDMRFVNSDLKKLYFCHIIFCIKINI